MAKLNVVIPAADVEVIGEGGVKTKYRKVDRKARVGDIVRITADRLTDVENGAFYPIEDGAKYGESGVLSIVDDGGCFRWGNLSLGKDWEVYEKVAEQAQQYREVKRPAKVGELIKIIGNNSNHYFPIGEIVKKTAGDRADYLDGHDFWYIKDSDYVVLEPIGESTQPAKPKRLTVGDYAKVVEFPTSQNSAIPSGTVVKITRDDSSGIPYLMETLDGKKFRWAKVEHLVRATESEVAAAQRKAKESLKYGDFTDGDYAQIVNATGDNANPVAIENADKFVKVTRDIGGYRGLALRLPDGEFAGYANADALRKVTREEYEAAVDPRNQFAKGDKVRIVSGAGERYLYGYENGDIVEIEDGPDGDGDYVLTVPTGRTGVLKGCAKPDQLEKVSAEELAKQAEESKWAAIGRKVGEFKRGDVVKVIRVPNGVTNGHKEGAIGEVVFDTIVVNERNGNPHIKVPGESCLYCNNAVIIVPVERRFDKVETAQAA